MMTTDLPEQPMQESTLCDREVWNVREVRLRLPRAGISALKQKADADDISVNALIARYIDQGLKADARAGLFELAPWFRDYLRPKGGRDSRAKSTIEDVDFT